MNTLKDARPPLSKVFRLLFSPKSLATRPARAAVLLSATLSASVHAQVDAERFHPSATTDGWVNAEGSGVRSTAEPFEFGAYANYNKNSLVVVDNAGSIVATPVDNRVGVELLGSMTIFEPLAIGVALPTYVFQDGTGDPSTAGLGDLRIVPKLRLLDDRDGPLGLAISLETRLPTSTGDFDGASSVSFMPKVIADHRFLNGIRIGANVGIAIREETAVANILTGHEFLYAGAVGYRVGGYDGKTEIGVEFNGSLGLGQLDVEEAPLEGLPFVRQQLNEDWSLQGGLGVGLLAGYGIPTMRGFAGVRFAPSAPDQDKDGIPDSQDPCLREAEDRDGHQDSDGCPEEGPDNDQDGIDEAFDECPSDKETINGIDDEDGCPDTGDRRVIFDNGEFVVLDAIHFEHGSAGIKKESHELLDQIALTIKANPQIDQVRVEGHTDDTGPEEINQRLSQERAESVRGYLVQRGVTPRRLTAKGYGSSRPKRDEKTEEARSKNRRVDFVVISGER